MQAPHIITNRGLLIEFATVIEAAKAVDKLQEANSGYAFEFVQDPCKGNTLVFKGRSALPNYIPGGVLLKSVHLIGIRMRVDVTQAIQAT